MIWIKILSIGDQIGQIIDQLADFCSWFRSSDLVVVHNCLFYLLNSLNQLNERWSVLQVQCLLREKCKLEKKVTKRHFVSFTQIYSFKVNFTVQFISLYGIDDPRWTIGIDMSRKQLGKCVQLYDITICTGVNLAPEHHKGSCKGFSWVYSAIRHHKFGGLSFLCAMSAEHAKTLTSS